MILLLSCIGCLTTYTGGKLFYYPGFNANKAEDAIKFGADLSRFLAQDVGLEAVIRIRASQGVNIVSYHGSFFYRSADLIALPNVNPDHSYTVQCALDEKVVGNVACFQAALLHTTCYGERRIRVLNLVVGVTDDPRDLFANADQGAVACLLTKMAIEKVFSNRIEDARDALVNKCIEVLGAFGAAFNTKSLPQVHVTENLRCLPLLILAILKSPAFRGGNVTPPDVRANLLLLCKTLSVEEVIYLFHPYLAALHTLTDAHGVPDDQGNVTLPPAMMLTSELIEGHGIYLLDNAQDFFFWIGSNAHPDLVRSIFGKHPSQLESGKSSLPLLEDDPWSVRVNNIVNSLREKHGTSAQYTYIIKEDTIDAYLKNQFLSQLIGDRGLDGQPAYSQWLNFLHGKIASTGSAF